MSRSFGHCDHPVVMFIFRRHHHLVVTFLLSSSSLSCRDVPPVVVIVLTSCYNHRRHCLVVTILLSSSSSPYHCGLVIIVQMMHVIIIIVVFIVILPRASDVMCHCHLAASPYCCHPDMRPDTASRSSSQGHLVVVVPSTICDVITPPLTLIYDTIALETSGLRL